MDRIPLAQRRTAERSYLARLLETAPVGIVTIDESGRVLECNDETERLLGLRQQELIDRYLPDVFDSPGELTGFIGRAFGSQTSGVPLILSRTLGERTHHLEVRVATLEDDEITELALVVLLDVTDRVEAEEARQHTLRQIEFVSEASRSLSASLQVNEILETLVSLAVPSLGDWCAVDLMDREGAARPVIVRHRDDTRSAAGDDLKSHASQRGSSHPMTRVLDVGRPILIESVDEQMMDELARDEQYRELLLGLGVKSAMAVPLDARGRRIGAMLIVRGRDGKNYGPADLAVAHDLGGRAALAMDNARLFQEHRHVARKLQESLLPPGLPTIPAVELGASYHAAGEGVEVGGDFYDIFRLGGRSWGIVIGDVSGKGPEAAGITALARYTARAAAMQVRSPRRIFSLINEALLRQTASEKFASVAFVRLETSGQPGPKKIVVASGGHPLPLVLRAGGEVEELGDPGTILGLIDDVDIRGQTLHLHPGDLMVLFTDGVTEARNHEDRLLGAVGLKRLLSTCRNLEAAAAAERLSEVVLEYQGREPRDDIAIVTIRVPPLEAAQGPP